MLTLEVPPLYYIRGKTYESLFKDFLTKNCICIGIYRKLVETEHDNLIHDEFSFLRKDKWSASFRINSKVFHRDQMFDDKTTSNNSQSDEETEFKI